MAAQTYTPDMVWVSDDVFTINHQWLRTMLRRCARRGMRIPFECISRADRLNSEMLDLLAELGCFRIWIGSESGSQRILDAMDRGVKIEQVHQAVAMSRERGIESGMFLMWGYEGEEMEDIEATIAMSALLNRISSSPRSLIRSREPPITRRSPIAWFSSSHGEAVPIAI